MVYQMLITLVCFVEYFVKIYFLTGKALLVCIYTTPPPQAGCDTRSIFKQSKASLKSEFFFS